MNYLAHFYGQSIREELVLSQTFLQGAAVSTAVLALIAGATCASTVAPTASDVRSSENGSSMPISHQHRRRWTDAGAVANLSTSCAPPSEHFV